MDMKGIFNFNSLAGISDTYSIYSNALVKDGYPIETILTDNGFESECDNMTVSGNITAEGKIFSRKDTVVNTSGKTLEIYDYKSRFCFLGDEYEIYTQYNGWSNESVGNWQRLNTKIEAEARGTRMADAAAPMLGVWDMKAKTGVVFHLLSEGAWKMSASAKSQNNLNVYTVVEISLNDPMLKLELKSGESFEFPEILYYEFKDKDTFDAYLLHEYMKNRYPRKTLPVMYDTWLAFFDRIELDKVYTQIDEAARLGCEYFNLDAGWFGTGEGWNLCVGDWVENTESAYKGNMRSVSDRVHERGMKFGLWLEPERCVKTARPAKQYPEYYLDNGTMLLLDFANENALKYITDVTLGLVERYNIDFFKFDFNTNLMIDPHRSAFTKYYRGFKRFIKAIRDKYPDIYLEACASGGFRTTINMLDCFDSVWPSDNHCPFDITRIYRDTMLRMLPSAIEKWIVITDKDGFTPTCFDKNITSHLIASADGLWSDITGVSLSYLKGFFKGGPIGISCDLTMLNESTKKALADMISEHKKETCFTKDSVCRVLSSTERLLALQYSADDTVMIVVYTAKITQPKITVYPVLDSGEYEYNEIRKDAGFFEANGITVCSPGDRSAVVIKLEKK